jgi:hypothetical protein
MVPVLSAALGTSLCAFGLAGIALSSTIGTTYDALCLITGILALMVVFERRWVVRRIWTVIAVVHGAVFVMAAVGITEASLVDLMVSAMVTALFLIAGRRVQVAGYRRRRPYGFDERLPPERADLIALPEGSGRA